jgi:hypothetical protein
LIEADSRYDRRSSGYYKLSGRIAGNFRTAIDAAIDDRQETPTKSEPTPEAVVPSFPPSVPIRILLQRAETVRMPPTKKTEDDVMAKALIVGERYYHLQGFS